ncbi:BsaA family SipW-dependent biofilm matrix protein [Enterococcus sp. LJL51]|uniref:BsaA family SipW-dependent biofilm matrix protein n=1 Tax=Enterococcus sp. LJL51 TaxID=3416656 RepID=UPI003CF9BFE8
MKQTKSKKKWVAAATTLATVAVLAGTFAWFTSADSETNHFEGEIAGNDVEVVENFIPPTDWKPGEDVNKDVSILNSGNYDSLIRVSFDEILNTLVDPSAISIDTTTAVAALDAKTKEQIYLYPLSEEALVTGTWTDVTGKLSAPVADFVVASGEYAGTYKFAVSEQATTVGSETTYKNVAYWTNGTDKYYAKSGGINRADDGTITLQHTPELKYVDLTTNEVTFDWTLSPYAPTFTVGTDGTAKIKAGSDAKGNVELNFVNLSATPTADKWYYNAADGYFYFVAIVPSQTQTAQLLDSVNLNSAADNSYSKLSFDLTVNGKSIQATAEAVDSSDWVNATNGSLKTALEGLF